jgi:hypothetical protein
MENNNWTKSLSYNYHYKIQGQAYEGYHEASQVVKAIIDTMLCTKKIISSQTEALKMARNSVIVNVTKGDLQNAYDIAAGNGCEYEWEYE